MSARQRLAGAPTGLLVPLAPRMHRYVRLTPLAERDWLTRGEIPSDTGIPSRTADVWRHGGLLPATIGLDPMHCLYHRREFARIAQAARHGTVGASWPAVRAAIDADRQAGILTPPPPRRLHKQARVMAK